jgi:NRPS condensation-like uncharacterized protein
MVILSSLESQSWLISQKYTHNCIAIMQLKENLEFLRLEKVLNKLFEQEIQLHKTINFSIPTFNCSQRFRLPLHEIYTPSWKDSVFCLINQRFPENSCLIKFVLARTKTLSYLIIVAHHIILDGISMMNIINFITSNYSMINYKKYYTKLDKKNKLLKINIDLEKPDLKISNTRIEFIAIDHLNTREILNFGHVNKISIVSILAASFSEALKENLGLDSLKIVFPVNLRNKIKDKSKINFQLATCKAV